MTDTARPALPERTAAARLIVVIRGREADQYAPVLETLAGAGIRSVELTLSTPGTLEALPELLCQTLVAVPPGIALGQVRAQITGQLFHIIPNAL